MILYHSTAARQYGTNAPTTPSMQRPPALTHTRFSLFRFRSPLLTESRLFSLPVGTEMFHFPTFPPTPLYIQGEVAGHDSGHLRGFPIRTSTDQSSFTNSPWLIAGYNVLHRLLMPRHPPIALSSLSPKKTRHNNKTTKMLASTIQFSTNPPTPNPHPDTPGQNSGSTPNPHHQRRKIGNPTACTPPTPHHPQTFHTHPTQSKQY